MGGREGGWRLRESRPKFVNSFVCACRVHCGCYTPPYLDTTGARCVLLHPVPPPRARVFLPPHPPPSPLCSACLSTSIPFDHTGEIHLVARFTSPRSLFPLPHSLSQSLFPPRSRCNERCTLSSSCSRRRCFHSAAQSVSARLPARFVQRWASAGRSSVTRNEPKRTWEEIDTLTLVSRYRILLQI